MSHRRGKVGIGKVVASTSSSSSSVGTSSNFTKKAQELKIQSLHAAVSTLQELQNKLEEFAFTYQKQLRDDPAFRYKFFQMCAPLGIDVLCRTTRNTLSHKTKPPSFWSRMFQNTSYESTTTTTNYNSFKDRREEELFYNELSVKVAEVCIASRIRNGGIISVLEVQDLLGKRKRTFHPPEWNTTIAATTTTATAAVIIENSYRHQQYSMQDIIIAVSKLSILGSMKTITLGQGDVFIQSVPAELDQDHYQVLTLAQVRQGHIAVKDIIDETTWGKERAIRAIHLLLSEGMAWLDLYNGNEIYWFPRYGYCAVQYSIANTFPCNIYIRHLFNFLFVNYYYSTVLVKRERPMLSLTQIS